MSYAAAMRDQRLDKLARVLVEYSTGVRAGQLVRISGDPVAMPLVEAVYERVLAAGAHPLVRLRANALQPIMFRHGNDEQLGYVPELAVREVETIDVSIGIWAEENTRALSRVDPVRQGLASAANRPLWDVFMKRAAAGELKWCGTQYPTQGSAQDAEMSLHEYETFVFGAGHLDADDPVARWREIQERQQRVADYLQGKREIHFLAANGTDLRVNVEGMMWVNCAGHENFPDGEVFTGPNLDAADGGVNGTVRFSFPAVHHGREATGVVLEFEKGRVVKATAEKGEHFLKAMIEQDEGASRLGEIALGTNYDIREFSRNTLFDEKIGGTFHSALGAGYPETGNTNQSGLHWDMVCDMREASGGGVVTVDGEVISRDGRFVCEGWPGV